MRGILLVALALAGCSGETENRKVSAVLDADLRGGSVMLTCRESTSGACHVLFVTEDKTTRLSAAKGDTASITGVAAGTSYCIGGEAPKDGCSLRALPDGQSIFRSSSTRKH